MRKILTLILERLAKALGVPSIQERIDKLENPEPISSSLYLSLENQFRGDPALIAQRQSQYLASVVPCVTELTPLLDIGCGRGEWLGLLAKEKLPARGVDSNPEAVALCQQQGLEVTRADLISELESIPAASLGAITFFQVFEHLPFSLLLPILKLTKRALAPHGVIIVEIPNIETLRVGAATFWIDPTHQRPLFPEVLVFLAQEAGFSLVETVYSTPLEEAPSLKGLDSTTASIVEKLHQRINGNADFAIIAKI
jgi:O-antigen chain-terminating methyltransferase